MKHSSLSFDASALATMDRAVPKISRYLFGQIVRYFSGLNLHREEVELPSSHSLFCLEMQCHHLVVPPSL